MSAIRDPATITKTGRQMVTAGGDITYTKAVLYGQDISHLTKEQVEGLTSIGDPLVTVPIGISDKNDDGNGTTVVLEATFQNSNLKADLPYKAVGFFAKKDDGDEKLVLVGVATDGAYLAATSPDGVATDSLDIKIAVAVGDASNVTAVVDPAGSVTPATLNGAISKATHDLTDKINTKADKTDLDSQIGIVTKSVSDLSDTVKANKDDTDKALATKADKATVESALSTKANQSDLDKTNAEVAKKASTTDVNSQLATKADAKDVTDALALKDDTVDVDKKISNVTNSVNSLSSTVTSNKSATDTALDTKADKTTVNQELATKANSTDVDDKLAAKADYADVTKQIKTITDLANTKADQTALDATNATVATKANSTDVDSEIAGVTKSITDVSNTVKANKDDADKALATKADKTTVESELAIKANSTDVDKKLSTKANSSDVYTKEQVDDAFSSRDATIATKADKATVDAEISKIDFTPYAKTADVNKEIKTVTDLANTKVGADYSYSKAELDKKLLALSTDTSGKVNASQVASMIAGKADKTDVDQKIATVNKSVSDLSDTVSANKTATDASLATKANASDVADNVKTLQASIDTKADKTALDDYAKSADVASDVKTLTDSIATKADKATVDAEISKIDFTPYAKTADVDSKLQGYTNTADLTKLLDVKANAVDVYSKTELDKKLLDLSTDTDGKVNADQVSSMIANKVDKSDLASDLKSINDSIATKADKTTVEQSLSTKANSADVTKELATKADSSALDVLAKTADVNKQLDTKADKTALDDYDKTIDVDSKIKTVTDLANTKADQASLDATNQTVATKANSSDVNNQLTDIKNNFINTTGNEVDNQTVKCSDYLTNTTVKFNSCTVSDAPSWFASEFVWLTVHKFDDNTIIQKLTSVNQGNKGDVAVRTVNSKGDVTRDWRLFATNEDINNLKSVVDTKADTTTVNSQVEDAKNTAQSKLDQAKSDLTSLIDNIKNFNVDSYKGRIPSTDMNKITDAGLYGFSNTILTNSPYTGNRWGLLLVIREFDNDPNNIDQFITSNGSLFWRNISLTHNLYRNWKRFADDGDVAGLKDQINIMLTNLNNLQGKQTKDKADANDLSATGVYYVSSPSNNFPVGQWGTLVTNNANGQRSSQFYFPDDNSCIWFRTYKAGWKDWVNLANVRDITTLHDQIDAKVNTTVPLFRRITAGATWNDILGTNNGSGVLVSIRDEGGTNTLGNFSAAIAFGGGDTKGVLNVSYSDHTARVIGGNGTAPVWHEDIAWKSDINNVNNQINSTNQTVSALQQTIKTLNDTISSANATIKTLQDTVNTQATTITGLQTQVSNQANEISYIKANYIEGKRFAKSDEESAEAWEKANPQRIAFIEDE